MNEWDSAWANDKWTVEYQQAIRPDGSLYFPERLTKEFLDGALRTMGSYYFANQYQGEIIPDGDRVFKQEWFKYYDELPRLKHTFAFIDPAISMDDGADYTGVVIADVDVDGKWYVRIAKRTRLTPTQIISLCFDIQTHFDPMIIGIEEVAYQKSLLYFLQEEMLRRNQMLPIKGIKPPTDKTKQMRIMSLVPRFEWGHIYLAKGLNDLEMELLTFPRSANDDISDALAYIEFIAMSPTKEKDDDRELAPNHPDYEAQYRQRLAEGSSERSTDEFSYTYQD